MASPPTSREPFHAWAGEWYARLGVRAESAAYLDAVAAWRAMWRPECVRVLLVAESHVGEHPGDEAVAVMPLEWAARRPLPGRYVRLIYCLGYGESEICSPKPVKNSGTPQFWNIFGQIAFGEPQPPKNRSTLRDRLGWKVSVLDELQRRGIWLQDASPLGVYLGGGARLNSQYYKRLLQQGYNRYVWPMVASDDPHQVWVIGKGVASALSGLPGVDARRVISQPQDRDRTQHLDGLRRLCDALR